MVRERVAVIFHRFGPYHVARLAAAARVFDLLAVEEAAESSEYAWDAVGGDRRLPSAPRCSRAANARRGRPGRNRPAADRSAGRDTARGGRHPRMERSGGAGGLALGIEKRRAGRGHVREHGLRRATARLEGMAQVPRRAPVRRGAGRRLRRTPITSRPWGCRAERIFPGYDAVDNAHFATGAAAARADALPRAPG